MFAATVALWEEAMIDPDRETRQKIRAIISGVSQEYVREQAESRSVNVRTHPKKPPANGNPFGDGTTVLPSDFKEQPLG